MAAFANKVQMALSNGLQALKDDTGSKKQRTTPCGKAAASTPVAADPVFSAPQIDFLVQMNTRLIMAASEVINERLETVENNMKKQLTD